MDEMAFVPAAPVLTSTRARTTSLSVRPCHDLHRRSSPAPAANTPTMQAYEFQTYSGGLDRVSIAPYSITRYLFKNPPASLNEEDKETAIAAGLRQIFGNAYLMEEERAQFYAAESNYRCGNITAKEFVRAVAKSETYRQRFFDSVSQFRFIELNFKHFLGRAPLNQVEYSKHFKIFAQGGYEAEIDSYFDDGEYDDVFGEDVLPFTRFRGTYAPINQFNRMCTLEGGFAGSDKYKGQQLVTSLASNVPTSPFSIVDGLPAIPNSEHPSKKYDLPDASLERYRNELSIARARALQLGIELQNAYTALETRRGGFNTFKAMVSGMDFVPLPGPQFTGPVENYPTWSGPGMAPKPWGVAGVDRVSGPIKQSAVDVSKKEKAYERNKQLVVDLERRVAVLEAEREKPAVTPEFIPFTLSGLPAIEREPEPEVIVPQGASVTTVVEPVDNALFDTSTLVTSDDDPEAEDSNLVVPKTIEVEKSRALKDVGKLPKELMEELEEKTKAEGKEFGGPKDGRLRFPGDGSEMIIG